MSQRRKVWVVLQYTAGFWPVRGKRYFCFEFAGVFETEAQAVASCRDENYLVGPATMGQKLPHRRTPWKGCYYPKAKKQRRKK